MCLHGWLSPLVSWEHGHPHCQAPGLGQRGSTNLASTEEGRDRHHWASTPGRRENRPREQGRPLLVLQAGFQVELPLLIPCESEAGLQGRGCGGGVAGVGGDECLEDIGSPPKGAWGPVHTPPAGLV